MDFVHDYELTGREHRVRVREDSRVVGQTVEQLRERRRNGADVVAIERWTGRHRELLEPSADVVLRASDVLLVDAAAHDDPKFLLALAELKLEALPQRGAYFTDFSRDLGMAEVLLPPDSELLGQSVLKVGFQSKYRLNLIGVRRGRKTVATGVSEEKLRPGDTLLVMRRWKNIRTLQKQKHDFLVLSLPAEIDQVAPAHSRAPYALGILAVMVTLIVTGWVPWLLPLNP